MFYPLPHTAAIAPKTGDDTTGQPTYGTAVNYKCRFELDKAFKRLDSGQTIESDASIIIGVDAVVAEGDQVTVTSKSFTGTVLGFSEFVTLVGTPHHKELFLKAK